MDAVYTVRGYYDGPTNGIADIDGKPHAFELVFNEARDDYERGEDGFDLYYVQMIDDETLKRALEEWEIWTRWERSFHSGKTTAKTHHPAMPEDRSRHVEIKDTLEPKLAINHATATKMRGKFLATARPKDFKGWSSIQWQVEWRPGE